MNLRFWRRRSRQEELGEEIESHLRMAARERVERGENPLQAEQSARREFGNAGLVREVTRDQWGFRWLEQLLQDLRYGVRTLRKSPGFTAVAILTLALGIGANTAVFGIVDAVLLRPLPVNNPQQLTVLSLQQKGGQLASYFSYADYRDIREQASSAFSDMLLYRISFDGITLHNQADRIMTCYVTGNFFSMLGLKAARGRLILPTEGQTPGADPVIVLSYAYWKAHFGADENLIGQKVNINGHAVTVVGVTPRGFHGVIPFTETQAYLPLSMMTVQAFYQPDYRTNRADRSASVVARLKNGADLTQARSVLDTVAQRLAADYPKTDQHLRLTVIPEPLARTGNSPRNPMPVISGLFLALAVLVLVLACMNVANILLVRAAARQKEMAVRAALGGTRARLARQLLTESMLLAFLGGAAGILLGLWANAALASVHLHIGVPLLLDFRFDWRVFAYAFGAAALTGILVGIAPALRASRADIGAVLHETSRSFSSGRQRVRSLLVIAQVAGSMTLLIIAGLFTRSLLHEQHVNLGFDPNQLINISMDPHEVGYSKERSRGFYKQLLDRVRAMPGVQTASLAFTVPMRFYAYNGGAIKVPGYTPTPGQPAPTAFFNMVSPGYFQTLRLPLAAGHEFTDADTEASQHVAVINKAMASRFWPHEDPLGHTFALESDPQHPFRIVGVTVNSKVLSLTGQPELYCYLPLAQMYTSYETLQVRASGPATTMIPELRNAIANLVPGLPIFDVGTMNEALSSGPFLLFSLGALLAASLGALGLVLALVGVYGVISFAATQRTHEIGIRLALGAQQEQILRMILRQGIFIVSIGLIVGVLLALAASKLVGNFLTVSATDPVTYVCISIVLAVAALTACYIPARRAMRVDPMVALRYE
ncbi:MAG: ADOP family duplicated permease [Candidatus Acidiferrales bacterium]